MHSKYFRHTLSTTFQRLTAPKVVIPPGGVMNIHTQNPGIQHNVKPDSSISCVYGRHANFVFPRLQCACTICAAFPGFDRCFEFFQRSDDLTARRERFSAPTYLGIPTQTTFCLAFGKKNFRPSHSLPEETPYMRVYTYSMCVFAPGPLILKAVG